MKKLDSPSYLSWGALLLLQLPALPVAAQWALASKASSTYEGATSQARPAEARTSLKDAVNQLKQQYHVRIAFQEGLLNGKFVAPTIQADSVADSLEGSLQQLLPAAGLGFRRITVQQYVIYATVTAPAPGDHVRGQVTFAEDGRGAAPR